MSFAISLSTNPSFVSQFPVSVPGSVAPDPVESILEALRTKLSELGCPECCSGFPLTFIKESADHGGGTIIGNGYKLEQLTPLSHELMLAEGGNGVIINIGELSPDQPIPLTAKPARVALVVGSKELMNKGNQGFRLPEALGADAVRGRLGEVINSFDAIGFVEFPLVLRTNDPLIT
jgi:hypothetical protein